MDFNQVVDFYERIAQTQKRLEIINILAELFEECYESQNYDELQKIIYLSQGQLVSELNEWPKFGVAEKMVIQALVKYMGIPAKKIKDLINKQGDVGKTVEIFLEKRGSKKISYSMDAFTSKATTSKKKLEINHLYSELKKLAHISGAGSQETKINIITGLFRLCKPPTAKYVVNIILSTLRIGIATKTIMDSLVQAVTGTKANRPILERAYNLHPDLGKLAIILAKEGLEGLAKISVEIGIPIKMMLASRIQYPQIQQKLGGGSFIAEYKYDGERVQIHKKGDHVELYSRQLSNISNQYPDVIQTVRKYVRAENAIFEGEVVAMDPFYEKMLPFQVLSTRRRKYDIHKMIKEVPVCLFCFDILYASKWQSENSDAALTDGLLIDLPQSTRRRHLEALFKPQDALRFSTMKEIHNTEEMVKFFEEARNKGAEGIMNKKIGEDAVYQAGNRGFIWIKLKGLEGAKMLDTIDVVIIGASWGKGRRKGVLSPLFGAVYNQQSQKFEFLTRIGSGFTDEVLIQLTEELKEDQLTQKPSNVICSDIPDVWLTPKLIIEIMGDELTISNKADAGATPSNPQGYGLRFPVFQRRRTDKSSIQITTTEEIRNFYEMQG